MSGFPPSNFSSAPPDYNYEELRQEGVQLLKPSAKRNRSLISKSPETKEIISESFQSLDKRGRNLYLGNSLGPIRIPKPIFIKAIDKSSPNFLGDFKSGSTDDISRQSIRSQYSTEWETISVSNSIDSNSQKCQQQEKRRRFNDASIEVSPVSEEEIFDYDTSPTAGTNKMSYRTDKPDARKDYQGYFAGRTLSSERIRDNPSDDPTRSEPSTFQPPSCFTPTKSFFESSLCPLPPAQRGEHDHEARGHENKLNVQPSNKYIEAESPMTTATAAVAKFRILDLDKSS